MAPKKIPTPTQNTLYFSKLIISKFAITLITFRLHILVQLEDQNNKSFTLFNISSKIPTLTLKYIKIFKVNYLIIHPTPSNPQVVILVEREEYSQNIHPIQSLSKKISTPAPYNHFYELVKKLVTLSMRKNHFPHPKLLWIFEKI